MKNYLTKFLAAAATLAAAASASAYTFDVTLDQTSVLLGGDPVAPPLVGTGTLTFATDPGNGTFAFSALGAYSLNLSFVNGDTFSQADLTSHPSLMEVVLSGSGATRRVQFSDTGLPTGAGGNQIGSLDLDTATTEVTFEPSQFGTTLDLYQETDPANGTIFGNYSILEDPSDFGAPDASSTLGLFAASGLLLALAARRARLATQ